MGTWSQPEVDGIGPAPRGGHASVVVDKRLIIFGGADRTPTTMNDLWVAEPVDGKISWTRISASVLGGGEVLPRSGATLTAVEDRVYMFGGQEPVSGAAFNDVLVLDTKKWEWSELEVRGGRPPARHSHCAGLLQNHAILVFGGAGLRGTLGDVWVLNIPQRTWTRPTVSGYAPPSREMHSGVMVDPTTMLVFGGRGTDGRILCDAAVFDASKMSWQSQEATPFARCAHAACALQGASSDARKQVLVHGGFSGDSVEGDVLRIDPSTLEVTLLHNSPQTGAHGPPIRFAHSGAAMGNPSGKPALVIFGGVNPQEDLCDVAFWAPDPSAAPAPTAAHPPSPPSTKEPAHNPEASNSSSPPTQPPAMTDPTIITAATAHFAATEVAASPVASSAPVTAQETSPTASTAAAQPPLLQEAISVTPPPVTAPHSRTPAEAAAAGGPPVGAGQASAHVPAGGLADMEVDGVDADIAVAGASGYVKSESAANGAVAGTGAGH